MFNWNSPYGECKPQTWLRQGGTLEQLANQFNIGVKRHPLYNHLVQLKYAKVDCDFTNPLVRQCRGLILDESRNWSVVARPFDKFGNYGESYAADIRWASAIIQEKLDGSLMILYFYDRQWHVATSGTPDAGGTINGYTVTFADLFWDTWQEKGYQLPDALHEGYTFMWELTSPYNRVVVRQPETNLRLIGVRSNFTGKEQLVRNYTQWERVKEHPYKGNIKSLVETFDKIDPTESEGYVVVDYDFNRIKVKHPGYVALHHMKDGLMTPKNILEVVRSGEMPEMVAVFPELASAFEEIKALYDGLALVIEQDWANLELLAITPTGDEEFDRSCRKFFAMEANKCMVPGALFALLDGHVLTAKDYLKDISLDRLAAMLHVDEVQLVAA
jgi:T4 RnlA family RNA ligase